MLENGAGRCVVALRVPGDYVSVSATTSSRSNKDSGGLAHWFVP